MKVEKGMKSIENVVVTNQFIEIISKLLQFFKNDAIKTRQWLVTPNPMFGYIAPLRLIILNRPEKVLDFIKDSEEESVAVPPNWTPLEFVLGWDERRVPQWEIIQAPKAVIGTSGQTRVREFREWTST